jgi:hypothetical protein
MMAQRRMKKTNDGAANSRRMPQWLSFASGIFALTLVAVAVAGPAYAGPTLTSNAVVSNSGAILSPSWETFAAGSKKHAKPINLDQGAATGLNAPAGVAITADGHVWVADNLANAVLEFSGTANGNTAPEAVIAGPDTGLNTPSGLVIDADGNLVVTNSLGATLDPVSGALCSLGSITVYSPGSSGDAVPLLTIQGCSTALFEPVGIVADATTVHIFALVGFDPITGAPIYADVADFPANNRYWVTNLAVGYITVYLPDFTGGGDAPPAGGFFATTTDGLLLASIGGASVDLSVPDYIALGAAIGLSPEVYISDDTLGYKGKGRIKEFSTLDVGGPFVTCLAHLDPLDPTSLCTEFYTPFEIGVFSTSIEGKKTKLNFPQGIAALNTGAGDAIFVVNTDTNTLEEFSPGASGNVKPMIKMSGARTGMHEPVGLAVPGAVATPVATPTPL